MPHTYLVRTACAIGMGLLLHTAAWAQAGQRFTLIGRVRDAGGQGLPGATVLLKGTTQGATTGLDGAYSLTGTQVPGAYTLTFSLVGYRTESRPISWAGPKP